MTDWRLAVVSCSVLLGAAGACSSFSSDAVDAPDASTSDSSAPDASDTCIPYLAPLVANFDDGFGDLNDPNPLGGGKVTIDSGVLVAHVPWAISRAEATKSYALASQPFRSARLDFTLKDVVQPPINYVAAGCGIELTTAGGSTFIRFELKAGNYTLDDEVRYPDGGVAESGTGPALSVTSGAPKTLRVHSEITIDEGFQSVTSTAALEGDPSKSKVSPLYGAPTFAKLRCGIHNFSVAEASATKPGYDVAIDDVRLELCR